MPAAMFGRAPSRSRLAAILRGHPAAATAGPARPRGVVLAIGPSSADRSIRRAVAPFVAEAAASEQKVDVLLIGGGIMSATLGVLLRELEPGWTIEMVERLDKVAEESSNGWNNAGTGHSALCELNYTPVNEADG